MAKKFTAVITFTNVIELEEGKGELENFNGDLGDTDAVAEHVMEALNEGYYQFEQDDSRTVVVVKRT
jgi:hypothetical protein